jgi:hypothetical protein
MPQQGALAALVERHVVVAQHRVDTAAAAARALGAG